VGSGVIVGFGDVVSRGLFGPLTNLRREVNSGFLATELGRFQNWTPFIRTNCCDHPCEALSIGVRGQLDKTVARLAIHKALDVIVVK
jgi:hypothetical protein